MNLSRITISDLNFKILTLQNFTVMSIFFKKNKENQNETAQQTQAVSNQTQANEAKIDENKKPNATGEKVKVYNLIILDKSGSMGSIRDAAISGFNETVGGIRSAQNKYGDNQQHLVSLFTFCDCCKEYVYENVPVVEVKTLTRNEYAPCCSTPLYDAMGMSLNKLFNQIKDEADSTAVVTVITDGMENASREFSGKSIKDLVDKLQKEEGWNFAYIGTNQDVEAVAKSLSISNTMSFADTDEGMRMAWAKEKRSKMIMYDMISREQEVMACMPAPERKVYRSHRNSEVRNYRDISEFADRFTPDNISKLKENEIFVFGSNLEGMHAGGAARVAYEKFGATMGQGVGLQGQSYAIPTMQGGVGTIEPYVKDFFKFADSHPELTFLVTRIGCGIAGFTDEEIAPMFVTAVHLPNVHLPKSFWKEIL